MKVTDLIPEREQRYSYLVSLDDIEITLQDDSDVSWLHAMPIGKYKHPFYGKISFTQTRVKRFASHVNKRVRGIDIAIDYGHRAGDEAAGWVRQAEARPDGLWLLVEWTKKAAGAIRDKAFRYFSPEYANTWEDPKSNVEYKDVLLGGGLTNRPFLKDLVPVNLSEVFDEEDVTIIEEEATEEDSVKEFLEKLRKQMGLSEEATEEQILAAVAGSKNQEGTASAEELSELKTKFEEAQSTIAKMATAQRLSDITRQLQEWSRKGGERKFALPPVVNDKVKELLLGAPVKMSEDFMSLMEEVLKVGLVDLQERGTSHREGSRDSKDSDEDDSATKRFNALVEKYLSEHENATIGDAVEEVSRDEEELFLSYRSESYGLKDEEDN